MSLQLGNRRIVEVVVSVQSRYKTLKKLARICDPKRIPDKAIRSSVQATTQGESLMSAFDSWTELGLCEWKHALANPRNSLTVALTAAGRVASVLRPYYHADVIGYPFWFGPTIYVARLVTGQFQQHLMDLLPDFSCWRSAMTVPTFADVGHVSAMVSGSYFAEWRKYLSALEKQPECGLFLETQCCYMRIIQSGLSGAFSDGLKQIQQAANLFAQRQTDLWYSEMRSIEGGGVNNEHTIDYRLAAIVDHLYGREKMIEDVLLEHGWRY